MSKKSFRLTVAIIFPPSIASLFIVLAFSLGGVEANNPRGLDFRIFIPILVFVFGFIPSFLYSLAMEKIVKIYITEKNSKGSYLLISTMLGAFASSIPFFGPWLILGALIGLFMGYTLMKSIINEEAAKKMMNNRITSSSTGFTLLDRGKLQALKNGLRRATKPSIALLTRR